MNTETLPAGTENLADAEPRARLLQAMGVCAGERGFAATTIADIVREAGVSKRTFYEHFTGKEACFLALYRAMSASALRTLRDAQVPGRSWSAQLEGTLQAYFSHLASGPRLLRTLFVEILHLGPEGLAVRREVMQALAQVLQDAANGADRGLRMAPVLALAAVGGINELVLAAIERGEEAELPALAPAAADIVRLLAQVDVGTL